MNMDRWQRAKELFHAALEHKPETRPAFLDEACRGDAPLRTEVEKLLAGDAQPGEIMEPLISMDLSTRESGETLLGTRIGNCLLERVISSGGMGTVYQARQEHPRRTVAVKMMRAGIASPSVLRRFEYEAQIMASLRHPNIAQLFEAGTHGGDAGIPYFVMEYIPEAKTITDYAQENNLSIGDRLRLFMQVCEGVHHGHQKGIIHRDLKPGNLLADAGGHVKVIDFGVARATDSDLALTTLHTDVGQLLGTVQYMSPEQCEADPHNLDIRSDVYSLGIVLYELLCGKVPYDAGKVAMYEAVRIIREQPPERPSSTNRTLRGDVETITLKALEKDRERRYQSSEDLRRDIDRYLKGESIKARPPSMAYQVRSFTRRHKALVGGALSVFLVLVAGIIVSLSLYYKAIEEAEASESINTFYNNMLISADPLKFFTSSKTGLTKNLDFPASMGSGMEITVVELMTQAAGDIDAFFENKPLMEAQVRETMGATFSSLGHYLEAEELLRKAVLLRQIHLIDSHPDTLRSQVQLAHLLRYSGKDIEAEKILRKALEGLKNIYGPEDRQTIHCASILALMLSNQERYEESDPLFRETCEKQKRVLGKEDPLTLYTMMQRSYSLSRQGRVREQEAIISEAYDIIQGGSVPEDFAHLFVKIGYAEIYQNKQEYDKAESLVREAYERGRAILGDDSPITYCGLWMLTRHLHGQKKLEEKGRLLRNAQAGLLRTMGGGHIYTRFATQNLAAYLTYFQAFDEIEEVYRKLSASCLERLGEEHPQTLSALKKLAFFLLRQGKVKEGEDLCSEWVNLNKNLNGVESPTTLKAMQEAAGALIGAGKSAAARSYMEDALSAGCRRRVQPDATAEDFSTHALLLLTDKFPELHDPAAALPLAEKAVQLDGRKNPLFLYTLAQACHLTDNHDRAAETQREAIAALPPGETSRRWSFQRQLVRYLLRIGEKEKAKQFLQEAVNGTRLEWREGFSFQYRRINDGLMLIEEGEYEWAEPMLLDVYQKSLDLPEPENSGLLLKTGGGLVSLYEVWGKLKKAEAWQAKLMKKDNE